MAQCSNCHSSLQSHYHFCPQCGQNTHWKRFTVTDIFSEFTQAFTNLDKGILYLVQQLTIRPGVAAREYILEGKRKKYFNPFSFLLLVLGLYLTVNAFTHPYSDPRNTIPQTTSRPSPSVYPPDSKQAVQKRGRQVKAFIEEYTNLLGLLAIPVFSLVYYLFFRRKGIFYAEHLVANVLFSCYYTMISIVTTLILGLFFREMLRILNPLLLLFQLIYLSIAYYQFLGYKQLKKYATTAFATLVVLLVWIVLTSSIIKAYIYYGGLLSH